MAHWHFLFKEWPLLGGLLFFTKKNTLGRRSGKHYSEVKVLKKHNICLVVEMTKKLKEQTLTCPCNEPTASRGNARKPQIDSRGDGSDKVDSLRLRQSQHFSICRPELTDLYNETGTCLLLQSSLLLESLFQLFPLLCFLFLS